MNWQSLIERWDALAFREQLLLVLGTLFGLIIALSSYIWEPLIESRAQLIQENRQATDHLSLIRQRVADLQIMRKEALVKDARQKPLENEANRLLQSSAKSIGLTFQRFQPDKNNVVRVWVKNANFNLLMRWIHEAEQTYKMHIVRANILSAKKLGEVNGHIHLQY